MIVFLFEQFGNGGGALTSINWFLFVDIEQEKRAPIVGRKIVFDGSKTFSLNFPFIFQFDLVVTMSQPKEDYYARFKKQKEDRDREIEEIFNQLIQERDEADDKYQKLVGVLKNAFDSMESDENTVNTSFTPKPGVKSESKTFKCDICNKEYVWKQCLYLHMRIHTNKKIYKCSYCGKRFISVPNRKKHQVDCVEKLKADRAEKMFYFDCHDCGKEFRKPHLLSEHLNEHYKKNVKQHVPKKRIRDYFN